MTPEYQRWRLEFARAIDTRFFTIDFLDWAIRTNRYQFHPGLNAAIVTEFKKFPTDALAVCGVIAAGDLEEIVSTLIPAAEAWGKAQGCTFAMIESRPGWQRALKSSGYEPFQLSLAKEL